MGLCSTLGVLGAWWGAWFLPSLPAGPHTALEPAGILSAGAPQQPSLSPSLGDSPSLGKVQKGVSQSSVAQTRVAAQPKTRQVLAPRRAPSNPGVPGASTPKSGQGTPAKVAVHRKSPTSSRLPFRPQAIPAPQAGNASLTVVYNGTVLPPQPVGSDRLLLPFGVSNLKLFVPETQTDELFLLGVPQNPAGPTAPLLVGFHQFGVSHADLLYNTDFFEEAFARGWYVLTPLSANSTVDPTRSFSALEGQVNSRAALEWVCANYPIDGQRIYGVGFSSGGGMALSMAARYQDPSGPMFAAVVGHTGTIDIADSYANASTQDKLFFDSLYGGDPVSNAFDYRRTSSIHLDGNHEWLAGGDHMALNLSHLQCLLWYDTLDPLVALVQQNDELFDWATVAAVGGFGLQTVTVGGHSWDTLDEVVACDWLAQHSLQTPWSGNLLMDRNARFQHFQLVQDTPGAFSRLTFDIQTASQEVSLLNTLNVQALSWNPTDLGLQMNSGQEINVHLSAQDTGDVIVLEGVTQAPVGVRRDGVPTSSWSHSPGTGLLQLIEIDSGAHTWTLSF